LKNAAEQQASLFQDFTQAPCVASLHQLVGGREQRGRQSESEHPGGLSVDDQLDFGRYASAGSLRSSLRLRVSNR